MNSVPVVCGTEQRNIVVSRGAYFAGHLIDLSIMQLRLTLHDISEEELSEFSNVLTVSLAASAHLDGEA
jgi:hypothetical protein